MATAIIAACLMTTRADEPMMLISIGMALFVVDHHRFIFNTRLITRESVWANKQTKQLIPWCSQICCTYPMECIVAYSWKATQIDIIWGQSMIHVKDNVSFVSQLKIVINFTAAVVDDDDHWWRWEVKAWNFCSAVESGWLIVKLHSLSIRGIKEYSGRSSRINYSDELKIDVYWNYVWNCGGVM